MNAYATIFLLGLVCLNIDFACAQALDPCEPKDDYASAVDKAIDRVVGRQSRLSITTLPSFETESGLRLVGNDIYFVRFRSSFWGTSTVADGPGSWHNDFASTQTDASMSQAALSAELAKRVQQIYASAIAGATDSGMGGFDGIDYRFAIESVGCGTTTSPLSETYNGQLVKLAGPLSAHAQLKWSFLMRRSEEKILGLLSVMKAR